MDLKRHPYKIVLTQELQPNDRGIRNMFAKWVVEQFGVVQNKVTFGWIALLMNTTAAFGAARIIWNFKDVFILKKVIVWRNLQSSGNIGSYFFQNQQEEAMTLKGERYHAIKEIIFDLNQEIDLTKV